MDSKKILVLSPHPDDMEFGCGGTVYKFSKKGYSIFIYLATRGEYGGLAEIRETEQKRSASIIGAKLIWGSFNDTEVFFKRDLINEIERTIKKVKPFLIFVNFFKDTHQDHVALSKATITAARYINNILFYETPTSIDFLPNIYFDIGDVIKKKEKLLLAHESQVDKTRVKNLSIIESAYSTAVFRGYQARVKYAEAFLSQRFLLNSYI
ncbi:MAG: PIG-L deacetylase family protein [Elusimicrobiales bacterium]